MMANITEERPELMTPTEETAVKPASEQEEPQDTLIAEVTEAPASPPETESLNPDPKSVSKLPEVPQRLLTQFEGFMIPALVLFLLGCTLAFALPDLAFSRWQMGVPLICILVGIVVYGINKPDSRWVIRIDLWVAVLILGAMYYQARHFVPGPTDISTLAPRGQVELQGIVTGTLASNRLILDVNKADRQVTSGQVIIYLPKNRDSQPIEIGTRLRINGELSLPNESKLPGVFNYRQYLLGQHITALLKYPSRIIAFETSNQPLFVLQRWTEQLKQTVATSFAKALPSPQAEVLGGIVLGDKAIPVDTATKQAFIQTGLIHVLAASGMNVGIIAMAVPWLMKTLKLSRRKQFAVAMLAVAFYSLITGLPPSIQRAAAMLELALFLKMLNKELSPLFLLCVASTLLVLIAPDNIGSVGFQFSVLTTFGLMTMVSPLQEFIGYYITRWLAGLILVPLVAQLWIWPLSVAYFNQFPIHSVPLNIVGLVLVTPLTIIGFTAGIASILFAPLGGTISWLAKPFLDALLWIVQGGSSLTWAQWSLPSPAPWQIAGIYLCLFTTLAVMVRFKKWSLERKVLAALVPLTLLLGGLCVENSQAQNQTRLEWLPLSDSKQAVLVQPAHSNASLLITPQRLRYYEARSLGDFLKHQHIVHLNALILVPPTDDPQTSGTGSLKQALRQTDIDLLVGTPDLSAPQSLTYKKQQAFPTQGGQISLGSLHLEGLLNHLLIFSNRYCLLSLSQSENNTDASSTGNAILAPTTESCAVQASFGEQNTQLSGQAGLSAEQYHQWVQDGPRLTLF